METFKEILEMLFKLVIIPAIPILASYLTDITEIISQAVISTTQTYVDSLKAQGKFDSEAQNIAFEKTKTTVLTLLAEDAKEFIANMYGDVDLWLDTKIEQIVKETKTQI